MANRIKITKGVFATVLSVALILSAIFCVPATASATSVKTEPDVMTADDWKALEPYNGDFELGVEGAEVFGWTKEPIDNNTGNRYTDDTDNNFRNQFKLTTEVENGSKVLAVAKNGSGYIGAASQPVAVDGGASYTVSFDYILKSITPTVEGATATTYLGTRLYIEEFDAEGNSLASASEKENKDGSTQTLYKLTCLYNSGETKEAETEWTSVEKVFTVSKNTAYIVPYLYVGGQYQMKSVTYFDNVNVKAVGFNGDFDVITTEAHGGRAAGEAGPAGWLSIAANSYPSSNSTANYYNNYKALVENAEGRGNVLALKPKSLPQGYMLLESPKVEAKSGDVFNWSFDRKLYGYCKDWAAYVVVSYYNSANEMVKREFLNSEHLNTLEGDTPVVTTLDWATKSGVITAPANTEYLKLGFYIGGIWNQQYPLEYYYDNVVVEKIENVKSTFNLDFENSDTVIENWTVQGTENNGYQFNDAYSAKYAATAVVENGNTVMKYGAVNNITQGYAMVMSDYIPMSAGATYDLHFDYKYVGAAWDGMSNYVQLLYYDADKNYIGRYQFSNIGGESVMGAGWQSYVNNGRTTPVNTAYTRVAVWESQKSYNGTQTVERYFDNFNILVHSAIAGWTAEDSKESGIPRDTLNTYTPYYGMSKSLESDTAFTLFVKRNGGILGGAVYYSDAIPVVAGTEYTWNFDRKIENSTSDSAINIFGASAVVRWLNADGELVSRQDLTGRVYDNMNWTNVNLTATAPEGATAVQLGYVIGGYVMNNCPDLRYSYDNIIFMETEKVGTKEKFNNFTPMLFEGVNVDGNNDVDILDLVKVKVAESAYDAAADLNKNGVVNKQDAVYVRAAILGHTAYEQLKALF